MKKITDNSAHILIGLGGTGGKALKAFRKRLWEECPKEEDRNKLPIGYVYVDSDDEMMKQDQSWKVFGQSAQFTQSEFVYIKDVDLSAILDNPDRHPGLKHIVKNGEMMRKTLGEIGKAAGQKRRAGRILFAANINNYISAVRAQYNRIIDIAKDIDEINIHIITGLAGGTGSGAIIDAVTQLRTDPVFRNTKTVVTVYAMVPELNIPAKCQAGRYHQNGYAALCELSALNVGRFLPCDVLRGNEHADIDTDQNKQFGLLVYSNVNENGTTVDSFKELPKLLADTLYFRIFLRRNGTETEAFVKGLCSENINDFCVEYDTLSKKNDKERARTKAVSSFGIKRIVYPEQRIVEHVSYTLSEQAFRQILYNNFKEDTGFSDLLQRKDYRQNYIQNDSLMREWKLTDSFLMLNERILETDPKFSTIADFWQNVANFYSYDDAKNNYSNPLEAVANLCQEKFDSDFRVKSGVVEYYTDKKNMLRDYAQHIVDSIERNLYTQWYDGSISLSDLLKISEEILIYIREKKAKLPGEIAKCDENIEKFKQELADNMQEYISQSVVQRLIGDTKRRYAEHQLILADLYNEMTLRHATDFASSLIGSLQTEFEDLHGGIQSFVKKITDCITEAKSRIAERNEHQGGIDDMRGAVIEVRDDKNMTGFEKEIILNRTQMEGLSSLLRHKMVGEKDFEHFSILDRKITSDSVFDIIDNIIAKKVMAIHAEKRTHDKIVGINVLQQLQKLLTTDDAINDFARKSVRQSGVFILLNPTELNRSLDNNDDPVRRPETINREAILVSMPEYEGDDDLRVFANKLQRAFENAFGNNTPYRSLNFCFDNESKNEITIAAVKYCFPLRALEWMPIYEDEYKEMTESTNTALARESRVLLHSEGDGTNLPPIMGEKIISAQDFVPYFFVAAALGIVNKVDDPVNGEGWGFKYYDDNGVPISKFLSNQFTELITSEQVTSELRLMIEQMINKYFANPELTRAQRDQLEENVRTIMRESVVKECSSTSSQKYTQYSTFAEKAKDIIRNKR